VKKLLCMLIIAMVAPLLSGCPNNGSTAAPPPWLITTTLPTDKGAVAGDGRVKLEWIPSPGVDYWLFTATDPSLSAFNWTGLPNHYAYAAVASPFYMCGLFNGTTYYFAANGRSNGGPGGSSSPTINATPYNAASAVWATSSTPSSSPDLYGVGYTSLTTCSNNNTTSATGSFAAVGKGGAIFTSNDGKSWINQSAPAGFTTDLYAVTGYAANQNNPGNPALRWVAVGAGGASVYSLDGTSWAVGRGLAISPNPPNPALRSITHVAGTFFAVGDAGTILSSTDGTNWTPHSSGLTSLPNLNGITHGSIYVAVGEGGAILTSGDGNTWTTQTSVTSLTTNTLRQVTSNGNIIVAVGDSGTIVTSINGGSTWTAQQIQSGTPSLVGVAAESQFVANPVADPLLGFIANAQFVAVDSTGKAYTSVNGVAWPTTSPIITGISSLSNLGQPMVSSGFGYVAAGNVGATASAF
jgi:photosystem II stability/assembly factor-like uncharacterized protein